MPRRMGTVAEVRRQGDFQFNGVIKDDVTGNIFKFDYATRNAANRLEEGMKVAFLVKDRDIAYGIKIPGVNINRR